jgi:hypothetical protein
MKRLKISSITTFPTMLVELLGNIIRTWSLTDLHSKKFMVNLFYSKRSNPYYLYHPNFLAHPHPTTHVITEKGF